MAALTPRRVNQYHVFLASPGDVQDERRAVRKFFEDYNRTTARIWNAHFEVIDWENCSNIGVGRPQELITKQTLERFKDSLALVVGIMGQRFGAPSGVAESGTQEEFDWAMESHKATGWPEVKWFFRKVEKLEVPADEDEADKALEQWKKVRAFRKRMQDFNDPVFSTQYPAGSFAEVLARDLNLWLVDPARPWAKELAAAGAAAPQLPVQFDAARYQAAVLQRFDKLNFEMLDTTGAFYSGVKLWSVFTPQSVRECHQYNPRLLEIPKEHQRRMLDKGEITAQELEKAEQEADQLRQAYFQQPLRPVLGVIDEAFGALAGGHHRQVILGDPGSGKSSLIRYLALRWARLAEPAIRDTQPVPLVIELGAYGRWQCSGKKSLVRFLEEAPGWCDWPPGVVAQLLAQPGRAVMLLDGLDEVFDPQTREAVVNEIQRFSLDFPDVPIVVTSRVVGYQAQLLRNAEFRHQMLQDLGSEQIDSFLDHWHEETFDSEEQRAPKRDRLKKAIRESKSIAMLAGNPLLLTMMAILNRNQELPRDRAELYAQASRVLLYQWDTERALADFPGLSADIGLREKTEILRRVASHLQAGPSGLKGNLIDGTTLTGLIETYLREELRFEQARAAARTVVQHLRERNFILCFVGADSYAFVHRTFLEYFCAAEFVHRFNVAKTLDIGGLLDLFDDHCHQDEWREVLRLICGQIDDVFVGRIVEFLAERPDWEAWDGRDPLPEVPLAIWCLGEAQNPNRIEDIGADLLITVINCFHGENSLWESFVLGLLDAAKEIGPRWPGKSAFKFSGQYPSSDPYYHHWGWPHFLSAVFDQRSWIEQLAHCDSWFVRRGAMEVLVEKWPDAATRLLLSQQAIQDEAPGNRLVALQELVERWPDETTRTLLARRALEDDDEPPRSMSLQALAEKWPDEATRTLLLQRVTQDPGARPRCQAFFELSKLHSPFAGILTSRDFDRSEPYLDPLHAIPRNHIEQAAAKAGIPLQDIDTQVASLSAHLGWDITQGAKPEQKRRKRKLKAS